MAHRHGAEAGISRPSFEVADIFREHGPQYRRNHILTPLQYKAMSDIERCRTAVLGGHLDVCDHCGYTVPSYNSCRNRHCPKCQSLAQARWIQSREEKILPTHYFHGVLTLPDLLRPLVQANPEVIYGLFFRAAADTLLTLGKDQRHLGAQIGFTAVLHTWTREMRYHPHLHLIITGGGMDQKGNWRSTKENFLVPVPVLSKLFRGKFLHALDKEYGKGRLKGGQAQPDAFPKLKDRLYRQGFNSYAKKPFGGPENVFQYLGRYTHRVAISNHRLIAYDENGVTFHTKNQQSITVSPQEFIRRFLLHILPHGFTKIRHYGILAPANAKSRLPVARRQLEARQKRRPGKTDPETKTTDQEPGKDEAWPEFYKRLTGIDLFLCPACRIGTLIRTPMPKGGRNGRVWARYPRGP